MIFYLWFDWMASQLRFNLISNVNEHLPFQCEIEILDSMEEIINEFLEWPFLMGYLLKDILMDRKKTIYTKGL
ncbi:hypothetical protein [Paenibacillus crassostreae]|uniref:hypothetical protein n=1 Tax=Paenibacillus crassostreae TaxID=1763538 RepID=UPI0008DB9E3C|nr:hypothetical protein [Paenibacillus crassostreae]AOZ90756.1 hypothetical protein LPB68_00060 [Paenibacillus crassostreae]